MLLITNELSIMLLAKILEQNSFEGETKKADMSFP